MKIRLAIVLMGVFLLMSSVSQAVQPNGARILFLEGKVEVKLPGETVWKLPQRGAWLEKNSVVKTGPGAQCEIGIGQDRQNVVRMKENTRAVISSFEGETIRVDLEEGAVFALVRKLGAGSKFEVKTPTAVATARGTGWEQDMDSIQVYEDSVQVEGSGGEKMLVEEGSGLEFDGFGDLKEPYELSEEAKSEWKEVEAEAEQHAAEESALPADAGYQEPAPSDSAAAPSTSGDGESAPSEEAPAEGFDAFNDTFGDSTFEEPEGLETGPGEGEDPFGEAREEIEDTEDPEGLGGDGAPCSTANYPYYCP